MNQEENKEILAIIPARGGSKRLPNKNIMELGGKPLIFHTIDAALHSNVFDKVMVTTDSGPIKKACSHYDNLLIDHRSPELARDGSKAVEVILDICNNEEIQNKYDKFAMLLPTAPFRKIKSIKMGLSLLDEHTDSVVSLGPFNFPPQMAVSIEPNSKVILPMLDNSPLLSGNTRSQDQKNYLRPNGSFYFSRISSFIRNKSFFLGEVRGFEMSYFGSTDIDTGDDLILAQTLIDLNMADSDFL
jgi:CMP-N,N'-diacetyllegionaminic acid synthase